MNNPNITSVENAPMVLPKQSQNDKNNNSPNLKNVNPTQHAHHHAKSDLNNVANLFQNLKDDMESISSISKQHSEQHLTDDIKLYNGNDDNDNENGDETTEITEHKESKFNKRILDTSSSSEDGGYNNNLVVEYAENSDDNNEKQDEKQDEKLEEDVCEDNKDDLNKNESDNLNAEDDKFNNYYYNNIDEFKKDEIVILTPEQQRVKIKT